MRVRRARAALIGAALTLLVAGCGGVGSFSFAAPPDTTAPAATTTLPPANDTGVQQETVPGGPTTTTVAIQPGKAELSGTVLGPSGPVAGATVEADRYVGSASATVKVVTAADGSWTIANVKGGRFRVRAWMTPTLAMATPQIFFLGATQSMPVSLTLSAYSAQSISSAANPVSAPVGSAISVEADVSSESVDATGYVSYQPAANVAVDLAASGAVVVGAEPETTDADGLATFTLTCASAGSGSAQVTTPTGASSALPSLDCYSITAPAPTSTTTTTTPSDTTSTTPGSSTTTSLP